ncbi:hypothetical protein ACWDOP_01245 [Nocardia sp. NPDC003693]
MLVNNGEQPGESEPWPVSAPEPVLLPPPEVTAWQGDPYSWLDEIEDDWELDTFDSRGYFDDTPEDGEPSEDRSSQGEDSEADEPEHPSEATDSVDGTETDPASPEPVVSTRQPGRDDSDADAPAPTTEPLPRDDSTPPLGSDVVRTDPEGVEPDTNFEAQSPPESAPVQPDSYAVTWAAVLGQPRQRARSKSLPPGPAATTRPSRTVGSSVLRVTRSLPASLKNIPRVRITWSPPGSSAGRAQSSAETPSLVARATRSLPAALRRVPRERVQSVIAGALALGVLVGGAWWLVTDARTHTEPRNTRVDTPVSVPTEPTTDQDRPSQPAPTSPSRVCYPFDC